MTHLIKKLRWAAILVAGYLTVSYAGDAPTTEVIILAGQSNMVGQGRLEELPEAYWPMPENISFYDFSRRFDRRKLEEQKASGLVDLADDFWVEIEGRFGPEMGFAHVLGQALPDRELIIIKYAVGGTGQQEWSPNWKADNFPEGSRNFVMGSLFDQTMDYIHQVCAGRNVRFSSLLWFQGENDAIHMENAERFGANMNALIAGFRESLDNPGLKVFIGKVNPVSEKHKFVSIVQDQIDQVANEDDRVFTVSAEGISKKPDNIHYDSAGQIELGERFGRAWLKVMQSGD